MNSLGRIADIVYLLKDKKRRTIMKELLGANGGRSFKELCSSTGIRATGIAYHLKIMEGSGLIEKEFRNIKGRRDFSFYRTTVLGRQTLEIGETIYERLDGEGGLVHEQPEVINFIPSRTGPRAIRILDPTQEE